LSNIPDNLIPELFTRADIEVSFNCNERAAQRLIKTWIETRKVKISNKLGRTIYYSKTSSEYSSYQKSFIDNYIPNKTSFLNPSERKNLIEITTIHSQIDLETFSIRLFERMLVDLSWASSYLEGNTFSLLETENLILRNEEISGKSSTEIQMILNHKEAIKFITLNRKTIQLAPLTFKSIHALLAENLLTNLRGIGAIRQIPVGISGTSYTPISIPQVLEDEFEIFIKKAVQIIDPLEQSLFILIFIPYLQPFEDMNKRTSRIACNIPFLKNDLIPISFKNITQDEYILALKDIYEKNKFNKMKNLFISAVQFSANEYNKIISVMPTPKDILIKYRTQIKNIIRQSVITNTNPGLKQFGNMTNENKKELLAHVEHELANLHEGQLVRFDILPSQFEKWKKNRKLKN
jgi:hypothetical protein